MKRNELCWSMTRPVHKKKISHDNLPSARWRQEGSKKLSLDTLREQLKKKQLIHTKIFLVNHSDVRNWFFFLFLLQFIFFPSFLFFFYIFPSRWWFAHKSFRIFFEVKRENKVQRRLSIGRLMVHGVPWGDFLKFVNLKKKI